MSRRLSSRQRVPTLDGEKEAHLIAIACGSPPEGRTRWTLQWLAAQLGAVDIVEAISSETVRQTRKKTHASRGGNGSG